MGNLNKSTRYVNKKIDVEASFLIMTVLIKLLMLNRSIWNQLTLWKQMKYYSFKNKNTYKLFAYIYIYIYIYVYIYIYIYIYISKVGDLSRGWPQGFSFQ